LTSCGHGKFTLTSCQTFLNGTLAPECEPKPSGGTAGTIVSNALKSQLVTHEGSGLLKLQAVSGETLATITLPVGCPLGTSVPIIGSLYAKDVSGKLEVEEASHVLETGPLTELWSISKTTEHKTTGGGSVKVALAGEALGALWSGLGS
jgi:hypothetical protein